MATLDQLVREHGTSVLDHLDTEVSVPVITGLQHQGDVSVVPVSMTPQPGRTAAAPLAGGGHVVVDGRATGGHDHVLHAGFGSAGVLFDPAVATPQSLALGLLTVPEGEIAYLAHPEHGYSGIGGGTFELRRTREQAEVQRLVAD